VAPRTPGHRRHPAGLFALWAGLFLAGMSAAMGLDWSTGETPWPDTPLLDGQPADLNVADVATLELLPGIGPSRAMAIADERKRRPFAGPAELSRVRGIGPATVAGLGPLVQAHGEYDEPDRPMDINAASVEQLEQLPGIGPVLADRIATDRSLHGGYADVEALQRVRGIGPATVAKIRTHLEAR